VERKGLQLRECGSVWIWSEVSAQKTVEIFVFPASGSVIAVEFAFSSIEFAGVNSSAPVFVDLLRDYGMEHFVVNDVFEEPRWDKWRIQQWMNADHLVLFLDRPEDKVFLGGLLPFPAPGDRVTSQGIIEIFGIEFVE
jgi:hypothetical protein